MKKPQILILMFFATLIAGFMYVENPHYYQNRVLRRANRYKKKFGKQIHHCQGIASKVGKKVSYCHGFVNKAGKQIHHYQGKVCKFGKQIHHYQGKACKFGKQIHHCQKKFGKKFDKLQNVLPF